MLTNKGKYIPDIEEIKTAESIMTDEQRGMTDKRWNEAMDKINSKKEHWKNEINEYHRRDFISRQLNNEDLNKLINGDPTHRYHYKSLIPNMTQKEFIEFKTKGLSDDTLIKFYHLSHQGGDGLNGIISVGELRKQLQEQEGIDSPYIKMEESYNDSERGLCGIDLDYHDYDSFEVLGVEPNNDIESVTKKIEEVGALNYFNYLSPKINPQTISNSHYLLNMDCQVEETSIKKLSDKLVILYQRGYLNDGHDIYEIEKAELIESDELIEKLKIANSNLYMDIICNNEALEDFGVETDNDKLLASIHEGEGEKI